MPQGEFVILGSDGKTEHVFPAGMDPAKAAATVRAQETPPRVMVDGQPMSFEDYNQTQQQTYAPITLRDLIDDPRASVERMKAIVRRDVKDPKVMLPIALGVAGKAVSMIRDPAMPGVAPPPSAPRPGFGARVRGAVDTLNPDLVGVVSPRLGNAVRTAQGVSRALSPAEVETPAPPPTTGVAPTPSPVAPAPPTPPAAVPGSAAQAAYQAAKQQQAAAAARAASMSPAAPPEPPAPTGPQFSPEDLHAARLARAQADAEMLTRFQEQARANAAARAQGASPAPAQPSRPATPPAATRPAASAEMPSLDELALTPAEIAQGVKWHEQGVSPEAILHRILQSRQLTGQTGATTPDATAAAVRFRNEHGYWQDEGPPKR